MSEILVAFMCLGVGLILFLINEFIDYFDVKKEAEHKADVLLSKKQDLKELLNETKSDLHDIQNLLVDRRSHR